MVRKERRGSRTSGATDGVSLGVDGDTTAEGTTGTDGDDGAVPGVHATPIAAMTGQAATGTKRRTRAISPR
ncbi:hypothetical protein [Nocardioides sp. B-3]|uniref:hypothetical protein n=1 Tax=Nocardioides sp. B-3 TaxID=2895565 RepID=UPI00215353C1|nr:hypothetical protein [Nocardioides sp. B-3]UUZ57888.1 hypothetical protein LP418_16085 [Nocardioides sp. B-3]